MEEIPEEMYRRGRPKDLVFLPEEGLFIRFNQFEGKKVHPLCIRYPNQSVNRGKYSKPEWVLIPESKFGCWGYGTIKVEDIPKSLISTGGVINNLTVKHDPFEDNYSHSEIRAYRNSDSVKNPTKSIRSKFRVKFSRKIQILKKPKLNI